MIFICISLKSAQDLGQCIKLSLILEHVLSFGRNGPRGRILTLVLLRVTACENCEIAGSTPCEKGMHKGLRGNNEARAVDQIWPNNSF